MSIKKIPTSIAGCYELQPHVRSDTRGTFVKTFHWDWFENLGLCTNWVEQYYSVSNKGVLRGLHFQLPPHEHAKLVYCTTGVVMDVALDLRADSPTFRKFVCLTLSASKGNMIYLPAGLAHGFYTQSDTATLIYNVTTLYAPSHDAGIRWDSAGVPWPDQHPQVSERDQGLLPLDEFFSPFRFTPATSYQNR